MTLPNHRSHRQPLRLQGQNPVSSFLPRFDEVLLDLADRRWNLVGHSWCFNAKTFWQLNALGDCLFANSVAINPRQYSEFSPRLIAMSETPVVRPKRNILRRVLAWGIPFLVVVPVLVAAAWPSPYLIERPGPVYDALGKAAGTPIITIKGKPSYPTKGSLDLLTITFGDLAPRNASWLEVAMSYLDPSMDRIEKDLIYPPNVDSSQVEQESETMMLDSQANAKAAALNLLNIPFKSSVRVTSVMKNTPSEGVLKANDIVLTVDGEKAKDIDQIRAHVQATKGLKPVVFEIIRNGEKKTISIIPVMNDGKWRIGIYVGEVPEFPFTVDITLDSVSGPSAGQIFALAIYDKLTPGSLTGGNVVAGTGTVSPDGTIGKIGGIKSKMYGALRAGAKYFLAPAENCSEVVGNIPSGLRVIKVATLKDSLSALQDIREGKTHNLPSCTK